MDPAQQTAQPSPQQPAPPPDEQGPFPTDPAEIVRAMQQLDVSDAQMLRHRERALIANVWAHDLANRMQLRRFQVAEALDAPYGAVQPFPGPANAKTQVEVQEPPKSEPPSASDIGQAVAAAVSAAAPAAAKATPWGPYAMAAAALLAGGSALFNSVNDEPDPPPPAPINQTAEPLDLKLDWWYETDDAGAIPPGRPQGASEINLRDSGLRPFRRPVEGADG